MCEPCDCLDAYTKEEQARILNDVVREVMEDRAKAWLKEHESV
ncbi:MAG: hypothetical protein WAZ77_10720 [Candidatus Nitrosopolaris sp.]|jgi:hypothetical protein